MLRNTVALNLILLVSSAALADSIARGRLEAGQPQSATIRGGESHMYELSLREGEFIYVVVEQRGIDLLVTLTGPDGVALAEMDSPNYSVGPEPVCWIAASAGRYVVKVSSSEPSAPAAAYDIAIREIRPATDRDLRRLEAQTAALEAAKRSEAGSAQALHEAVPLYEKSARIWREVDEPAGEARALFALAYVLSRLGDTRGNLEAMQKALALQERIHDPGFEGSALAWTGIAYSNQGDRDQAVRYLSRAAEIQKKIGDLLGEAVTLGALGQAQDFLGDYAAAIASHRRSEEILLSVGDRRDAAIAQNNIALVLSHLGDWDVALEGYRRALAVLRDVGDRQNEAITLNNIAFTHQERLDWNRALEFHDLALPIRRAIGDRRGEAYTLKNLGLTQAKLGRVAEARQSLAAARNLQRQVGDRFSEATIEQVLGEIELDAGSSEAALEALGRALAIRKEIRDRWGEAESLAGMALTLRQRGDLQAARETCEAALAVVEALRSGITAPGQQSTFLGRVRSYYELEIDLLMRLHARAPDRRLDLLAIETSEKARARSLLELLAESRAHVRQGADAELLERDRSLRARLGTRLDAQRRLLGGKHTELEAATVLKEVEDLVSDLQQVEGQIRTTSPRYAALTQPRTLGAADLQALLDTDTVLLEYSLGSEQSVVWKIDRKAISSIAIGKRADIESAARAAYDGLAAAAAGRAGSSRREEILARLSRLILEPLGDLSARRIVIVADGALHFVPFAALPESGSGQPLLARHEVVNLPSGSTLALLRNEPETSRAGARTVAVFADPVFEKTDPRLQSAQRAGSSAAASGPENAAAPLVRSVRDLGLPGQGGIARLPFTRQEARAILDLVPATDRREALGFDATREAATSGDLDRFRYIHVATHGFVDSVHPELSGLVLSLFDRQGRDVAGFLPASDVFNVKLSADLVVLSACRTALGKEIRGEGLVGLTRAFMYAGTPRVVASLWRVDDSATAELMKLFYKGMLGPKKLRPAAALREAQLAVSKQKRWRDPYYWAAFVLQGEWN